ncbi:zinc-binding dehydrogenase [candidate division KSB1 bacterium]
MKAVYITKTGSSEFLEVREAPVPEPAPDEILVKIHAAGVNFADILAAQGYYPDAPKTPFIPGYEVAGVVEKSGAEAGRFRTGQRVVGFTLFGGYAEYAVCKEFAVQEMDENLSFEESASIPVNWLTAYWSIYNTGLVFKGIRALVHAAAGGVGTAAVQLLKLEEAEIFGTAGSDEKLKFMRDLGVDHPVNYRNEDFQEAVEKIRGRKSLDLIIDSIGPDYLKKGLKLLRPNGRIVTMGVASISGKNKLSVLWTFLRHFKISPLHLIGNSQGVYGVGILKVAQEHPGLCMDALSKIMELFKEKKVRPVIDSTYPLEKASEAHARILSRKSIGKVVLTT